MVAYIYRAALLCESCGSGARFRLNKAGKNPPCPDVESTYDSDDYPKGPYPDGGGESDIAEHCDWCNVSLDNPVIEE